MRSFILVALGLLTLSSIFAKDIDVNDRLNSRKHFLERYDVLFGKKEYSIKNEFKKFLSKIETSKRIKAKVMIEALDKTIPEKILMPLVYWKVVKEDNLNVIKVLEYYMMYKLFILRDILDNPLLEKEIKEKALSELKKVTNKVNINSENLFKESLEDISRASRSLVYAGSDSEFVNKIINDVIISLNLVEKFGINGKYSLSPLGLIGGNKVELISKNEVDLERIRWFNERVIFNLKAGDKINWDAPYIKMPTKNDPEGNIAFKNDPIFIKIRDMIDQAEESIFIDIFLFGGTIGATLIEYLVEKTVEKYKKNRRFKTLLLHDYATNYNMKSEMMPIFEYVKDQIKSRPVVKKSMIMLQANIQRHPPGIPFGLTNLIEKNEKTFKIIEKRNTYYESKIDHSKVIVIDGNTDYPKAYFGSKNWSDHSGGYYYDDALYIEGPAAALVQASYYKDIEAALTTNQKERSWFFFKEQGFGNDQYLNNRNTILKWFKITKQSYPSVGTEYVRLAEANVDGQIKNVRNMIIDMIMTAQSNIFMEHLFIYDKYINDALIKRKKQIPELDIRILADHNGNFGMNGLPNTIFMKELIDNDIKVRSRILHHETAIFPNEAKQTYHQENHRKIISVDGKVMLGGSSNLNPDTLQGSFREFGAQIFDKSEIAKFEQRIIKDWNDNEKIELLDIENLKLKLGKKLLDTETSRLINNILSQIIRSKDQLEKRH